MHVPIYSTSTVDGPRSPVCESAREQAGLRGDGGSLQPLAPPQGLFCDLVRCCKLLCTIGDSKHGMTLHDLVERRELQWFSKGVGSLLGLMVLTTPFLRWKLPKYVVPHVPRVGDHMGPTLPRPRSPICFCLCPCEISDLASLDD